MEITRRTASQLLLSGASSMWSGVAASQAEQNWPGNQPVRIIVGTTVGATYDAYARLIARHIRRFLPGQPSVVVQNMAGAGGMTAANYLFNVAPKDGTAFGVLSRGLPMQPYLDPRGVQYDTRRFTWLGSPASEVSLVWCWHTAPFQTFEDLRRQEMILPATGTGADSVVFPFVMNAILGTRFKIVQGYPGSPELFMAVERGEAQGVASTSWNNFATTKQAWVRDGKVRFLLQLGLKKLPDLPDLPLVLDLATNDADRNALELVFSRNALAYPFAAPPGLPTDRARALQAAFDQTLADPEVRQEALRQNLAWDPTPSGEMTELMAKLTNTPGDVIDRVKRALAEGERTSTRR